MHGTCDWLLIMRRGMTADTAGGSRLLPYGVLTLLMLWYVSSAAAFLNIAHMVNTQKSVVWAVDKMGANGVEMDLAFVDKPDGAVPSKFRHSPNLNVLCDCACAGVVSADAWPHVCWQLDPGNETAGSLATCMANEDATVLLNLVARKTATIALVYIDSKIDQVGESYSDAKLFKTGQNVYSMLLSPALLKQGYTGKLLVGAPALKYKAYLKGVWQAAKADNARNIMFTIDATEKMSFLDWTPSYEDVKSALLELRNDGAQIVFSTGISPCAYSTYYENPRPYYPAITSAVQSGIFNETLIWTLDSVESMVSYLNYKVTGIISNVPYRTYMLARNFNGKDLFSAPPVIHVPPAKIPCTTAGCQCDYWASPGGCKIAIPAQSGCSCTCAYLGSGRINTCSGSVATCDTNNPLCSKPDSSVSSCLIGGGNCGGYSESCNCSYSPGGCKISSTAPANTACKCSYKGFWTCGGGLTTCRNYTNPLCQRPDSSLQSCFQGGGDCNGYQSAKCDCSYGKGGCKITQAPPAYTACKCIYKGFWTCGGEITRCRDESSQQCRAPGKDKATCLQGGGDCGAY